MGTPTGDQRRALARGKHAVPRVVRLEPSRTRRVQTATTTRPVPWTGAGRDPVHGFRSPDLPAGDADRCHAVEERAGAGVGPPNHRVPTGRPVRAGPGRGLARTRLHFRRADQVTDGSYVKPNPGDVRDFPKTGKQGYWYGEVTGWVV
ncbi:hypothetical protein Nans01_47240 [Nocardiopsis ansamitocini]|uniref:Uncharacterized protein n=1 Tax=Nocardiopsis ansamitocini TaxID=1670832 RepID=A0A9W6UL74_9ACTN|nr:hypothetical protein Nans01_47240 [Nocardiopsis ansamitocini]